MGLLNIPDMLPAIGSGLNTIKQNAVTAVVKPVTTDITKTASAAAAGIEKIAENWVVRILIGILGIVLISFGIMGLFKVDIGKTTAAIAKMAPLVA